MTDKKHPIPIVLKDGQHVPLPEGAYLSGPFMAANFMNGRGTKESPLEIKDVENIPYKNKLLIKDQGLFVKRSRTHQMDFVIDLETHLKMYDNGFCLISHTCDYSAWAIPNMAEIVSFSWFCQTKFYLEVEKIQPIPYSLSALNWQPIPKTIDLHFVLLKKPNYFSHNLRDGIKIDANQLHYTLYFYYF
ncbi:hypothetical protein ID850_02275 [Xenorhabdus sp. Flor]|uniref:hypothetical protein n=1 Tax=Xenorhabdus cabanillasii TaxID=351673 RepID=UPI0019BC087A|nr:hypothetical protein [Xenorhabdus sp. Flor]MBD2813614.1 hypothetical protein [Xenorhabdus sp. Flor]